MYRVVLFLYLFVPWIISMSRWTVAVNEFTRSTLVLQVSKNLKGLGIGFLCQKNTFYADKPAKLLCNRQFELSKSSRSHSPENATETMIEFTSIFPYKKLQNRLACFERGKVIQ